MNAIQHPYNEHEYNDTADITRQLPNNEFTVITDIKLMENHQVVQLYLT